MQEPALRLAVVGVGLIGGSIGLAARERLEAEVRGWDPAPGVLEAALEHGAVSAAAALARGRPRRAPTSPFVAAPVGALPGAVRAVLAAAGPECVVTDVGSTKRAIAAAARRPRFIGGHPLAGAETAGRRARPRGALRGRDLVPDARAADLRASTTSGCTGCSSTSARGRRRSTRRPTTGSWRPSRTSRTCSPTSSSRRRRARCRPTPSGSPPRDRLPRRHARRGRLDGDVGRRSTSPTPTRSWTAIDDTVRRLQDARSALAAGDRAAVAAWNDGAREDRAGCSRSTSRAARCASCACRCPTARGSSRGSRSHSPRQASTSSTWRSPRPPTCPSGTISLWVAGPERAAQAEALDGRRSASRWRGREGALRTRRRAAARRGRRARRQVALAPRRAARRDGGARRARHGTTSTRPTRARRSPPCRRSARAWRPSGTASDHRRRPARRARAGRRRSTSATPARCCGCSRAGSPARRAARSRSTATRRSAGAPSTASPRRCGSWARACGRATTGCRRSRSRARRCAARTTCSRSPRPR